MGTLYIVATPIGNLKDLTFRALEILQSVDYILCEDTRVTGKLLAHFEIKKTMKPFNDFNEQSRTPSTINDLIGGQNIALVADAGTPLVSDPGYKLVKESIERGIKVESVPGPSAVICALTVSGLPPDKFIYLGYLPKKQGKLEKTLNDIKDANRKIKTTVILFESPHRLVKTLSVIKEIFADIDIVVCRELTKLHEEILRQRVSELIDHFSQVSPKGEFVILFTP